MYSRRIVIASAALGLLSAVSLVLLVALPYSTSLIQSVPPEIARIRPEPAFGIGSVRWDVHGYAQAKSLEPFRELLRSRCAGTHGVASAVCVSDLMAQSFPNGEPRTEFVNPTFDPVIHMRAHMRGEPGHCMNRSAILAATMLASERPARVVQILSPDLLGHTLVEVWDDAKDWTAVDPTFGLVLESSLGPANAWALVSNESEGDLNWRPAGIAPGGGEHPLPLTTWKGGTVLYPEPWLYLRTGERQVFWPFRGRYMSLQPAHYLLGSAQRALAIICVIAFLGALCGLGATLIGAPRRGDQASGAGSERPA